MMMTIVSDAEQVYPSQTKILEGATKVEIMIFEALVRGVSTRFGLRTIEKSVENPDFIFCSPFQNILLGSIKLCNAFAVLKCVRVGRDKVRACRP